MVVCMTTTSRPTSTHGQSRSAGSPGRSYTVLVALAVALVPAFVLVPGPLAASLSGGGFADQRHLIDSLSESFVGYWSSGDRNFSPGLERVVDYWLRYHVLIGMSVLSWRRFAGTGASDKRTRRVFRSFGLLWALLSLIFIVVAVANASVAADPAPALLALFKGGW